MKDHLLVGATQHKAAACRPDRPLPVYLTGPPTANGSGMAAGKDTPGSPKSKRKEPGSPKKRKASQIDHDSKPATERADPPRLKPGAQRIAADLEWTAQQYAKYEVFRQEQKEAREANMWSPSKSSRAPAKLEFKQRLDTTGPAAESTVVETLVAMGFTREQAESAAKLTKGRSLEDAAAFLLGGAAARAPRRR